MVQGSLPHGSGMVQRRKDHSWKNRSQDDRQEIRPLESRSGYVIYPPEDSDIQGLLQNLKKGEQQPFLLFELNIGGITGHNRGESYLIL